jgi:spore germination cell wall hydrolase CwlJ-like protein
MSRSYTTSQAIEFGLLVTLIGRESRGQTYNAKLGVAWSVRNRVMRPAWWGKDWISVIEKKAQYTSIAPPGGKDPNLTIYPDLVSPAWQDAILAAETAYWGISTDPTAGADHYFDKSLDSDPPNWATALIHTCDIDALRFYRTP